MKKRIKMFTAILCIVFFLHPKLIADSEKETHPLLIYVFDLNNAIDAAAWRIVKKAVEEAERLNADYLIMRLNTYGGAVDFADSIRTKLLNAKPITIVFIDHNAASAGALISIACDSIYMRKGSSIGAATVVNQSGEVVPDKFQSYMRSMMRSTAEAQGRNPKIAEAMVDPSIFIEGIIDSGKVLTFTTSEAIKNNFCEAETETLNDVLKQAGIKEYTMEKMRITTLDKIIGFLLNPVVSGLLMMLIFGGIYFELQTPGIGFPLAAAILGAILYFAPLYLEGLAANWEILAFIFGLILILLEIFVFPGFGISGIAGITLVIMALTLSLINNDFFDFSIGGTAPLATALFTVVTSLIVTIVLIVIFGRSFFKSKLFQKLVLHESQPSSEGYTIHSFDKNILNKVGIAITTLRPSGKVEIDNERYDASTLGEYIERGEKILVTEVKGNFLVVRKS